MSSPDTKASAAGVSAAGDSSGDAPSSPSERVPRAATPMRGMIGDKHPSVNLPPLPLPTRAEGEFGGSGVDSGDGFLVVGRDFNLARFDPVANSKFLDDRPWGAVDAFARKLVLGEVCLSSLVAPVDGTVDTVDGSAVDGAGGERATSPDDEQTREKTPRLDPAAPCDGEGVDPSGVRLRDAPPGKPRKTPRHTYRFSVRYYGPGFKGWAWSADDEKYFAAKKKRNDDDASSRRTDGDAPWSVGAFSASAATQKALAPLFANDTTKTRALWCAGRTDKGVHGLAQTVSFVAANDLNTTRDAPFPETVKRLVEASPAGRLGHLRVVETPAPRETHRNFHATFCATWRRYVYVFPMRQSMREERTPEREINVALLNEMLGKLVERSRTSADASASASASRGVDCYAFARDTVPGKNSRVVFLEARAFLGRVPTRSDDARTDFTSTTKKREGSATATGRERKTHEDVVVIELVADRFLRKLVRVLVATAAREAATGAKPDVLLNLADARERAATASAAPPSGLFFAGVGYGDHPKYDDA